MRTLVALAATLRRRRDPAFRAPAVAGNPQAAAIDGRVQSLTGSPHLTREVSDLGALIFEDPRQVELNLRRG